LHIQDFKGAIADYNKAIEINPKEINSYINRGTAKMNLNDYTGAIDDFSKAIEINQRFEVSYFNRGNVKLRIRDFEGAIDDYTEAIEINPKFAAAYCYRGVAKNELGLKISGCLDLHKAGDLGFTKVYEIIKKYCN